MPYKSLGIAVDLGAISVSADRTKSLDVKKFLSFQIGRERLSFFLKSKDLVPKAIAKATQS